jgi:hypothetical protein
MLLAKVRNGNRVGSEIPQLYIMTFHHPANIDARGSIINDVHHDQINIENYNVYITLGSTLGQALVYSPADTDWIEW